MTNTSTAKQSKNGIILHEDSIRVVIATGLDSKSSNVKTGGLVQVWILYRHESPIAATRSGNDSTVCVDCKHMGAIVDGKLVNRRCYVEVGKAPGAIWRCYARGGYRTADASEYPALFGGRIVRWGAYGDPVLIPLAIVQAITAVAKDWTGYTHQWSKPQYAAYRPFLMASVDSDSEACAAITAGWRYFRVRSVNDTAVWENEMRCPASKEMGNRTTCAACRLCNGVKYSDRDVRKSITIIDHSVIRKSNPLITITL